MKKIPLALVGLCSLAFLSPARGASVQTLDGKTFAGVPGFSKRGALVVTSAQNETITLDLTNLARATFASGPFVPGGSILPNGWLAQDIGETRGSARLDSNTFSLRVEGQTTNITACHFVGRAMHGDGDLVMRVEEVTGDRETRAGVMIRGPNNNPAFAALSLEAGGKLWFQFRAEQDRKEVRLTPGPNVSTPVLLRLQKSDKIVTAYYSTGSAWQKLASETVKLSTERTWREGEGELFLLRASCGVFISSRGKDARGAARVTPTVMALHGLLGEYFGDRQFANLKMARLDPQLQFSWGRNLPDSSMGSDDFSVRWTGLLFAPKTGAYSFYCDADETAHLWIDDVEMTTASFRKSEPRPPPVTLTFGRPVPVKIEYERGHGPAAMKLGWAAPGRKLEVIPMTNFLHIFTATNTMESIAMSRVLADTPKVRGVLLRDGSFIAGPVTKADGSAVWLSFAGRKDVPVLNSKIARLYLRPPRQPLPFEITQGRSGVFMKNGDFFESEFRDLDHGALTTSSVLFGLKRFWIDGGDPVVVVLNDCAPPHAGFEVMLLDGSIYRTATLMATTQNVTFQEAILGAISIPTAELFEIRRVGVTAISAVSH